MQEQLAISVFLTDDEDKFVLEIDPDLPRELVIALLQDALDTLESEDDWRNITVDGGYN